MSPERNGGSDRGEEAILGIDTGGTFTDFVLVGGDGIRVLKVMSTPEDPARAVCAGIARLMGEGAVPIVHGTTVATNALLEGKGAPVALVTTRGFRDILTIGRQDRPELYALHPARGRLLLTPDRVVEVRERVLADGSVLEPLEETERDRVVQEVLRTGVRSVAVCLLHAYANPVHEQAIAHALERLGVSVSVSHRILPEFREFERASTTVVNATVSPVMRGYLSSLQACAERLRVMQSNGGSIRPETAGREAVRTLLSGPAAGVVGAFAVAKAAGEERIITFDMGGTSTDVCLCDGAVPSTTETRIAGWPVKVPVIDIHTVGAGGGSIARVDPGGALVVGPESAGADPGPVCYGKGTRVTVTDANLFLGRIVPDRFLGGRMSLHFERTRQAMADLGRSCGLSAEAVAEGILEVVETTMAGALRLVSIQRGYDPRMFTLVPFGGAGGLHACSLARSLGIGRILFPEFPGLLSARGLVVADIVKDYSRSTLSLARFSLEDLAPLFAELEARARSEMVKEGASAESLSIERFVDMRYRGQSYELTVEAAADPESRFHAAHERRYGFSHANRPVEVVTIRVRARGRTGRAGGARRLLGALEERRGRPTQEPGDRGTGRVTRSVHFRGERRPCLQVERSVLAPGATFQGPALVVEETATLFVPPGWDGWVDAARNIVLEAR